MSVFNELGPDLRMAGYSEAMFSESWTAFVHACPGALGLGLEAECHCFDGLIVEWITTGGTAMTEERKVEVTVEDTPAEPDVKVEVNIEAPEKDKEDDE